MRAFAIALLIATGCGGKSTGPGGTGGSTKAPFPAGRWVPAQPTYVVSAHTMRDAQAGFGTTLDMLGMMVGFEVSEASAEFKKILGVDPLNPDAVAAIGVDLETSVVLFSENLNPTFVVHLKSPEQMLGYLDGQKQRGLRTQSVLSGGTEVFTARIESDLHVSWAIDRDWLWVHFAVGKPDGVEWFERSTTKAGGTWGDAWQWANGLVAGAEIVGTFDLKSIAGTVGRESAAALRCAQQLASVRRVGLNFDIDPTHVAVQLAFDLGEDAVRVAGTLMPAPVGWDAAAANAPIDAQWNADLRESAAWIQPCFDGEDLTAQLDQFGLRSARAFVHKLDPDDKEGVGAVSADLSNATFIRARLEDIPGRSTFESSQTFGQYKGKHVSVPLVVKGDYVLTDDLAIASMGDGLMTKIGTRGAPQQAPDVARLDLRPPGLPADVWAFLLEQIDIHGAKRMVQRMLLWSELSLAARLHGNSLVIEAHATRRGDAR